MPGLGPWQRCTVGRPQFDGIVVSTCKRRSERPLRGTVVFLVSCLRLGISDLKLISQPFQMLEIEQTLAPFVDRVGSNVVALMPINWTRFQEVYFEMS